MALSGASSTETARVDGRINQVSERFVNSGKWKGVMGTATFVVYDHMITLPDEIGSILRMAPITADGSICGDVTPYNRWYSLLDPSNIDTELPEYSAPYDLGSGFATILDPSNRFTIKAVCDASETSKTIVLRGLDDSNRKIYSSGGSIEGVSLALNGTTTTTQRFNSLFMWIKPEATTGVVRLYSVDVDNAAENLLAVIRPGKLVSDYRRYAVPWNDISMVRCLCKQAHVPAIADNDPVIPGNIGAIKHGLLALQREDELDDSRSDLSWARGIQILDDERQEFDGDLRPTLRVAYDYGFGHIPQPL